MVNVIDDTSNNRFTSILNADLMSKSHSNSVKHERCNGIEFEKTNTKHTHTTANIIMLMQ